MISEVTGHLYTPTIASDGRRMWACHPDEAGHYTKLVYSDDYGETWNLWMDIPVDMTPEFFTAADPDWCDRGFLFVDMDDNIYWTRPNALYRVEAGTKVVRKVLDFYPKAAFLRPRTWIFTQNTKTGTLYIGQYQGAAVIGAYIWWSRDNGLSWQRYDWFAEGPVVEMHVHGLNYSPYQNKLFFATGDQDYYYNGALAPKLWYSDDDLATDPKHIDVPPIIIDGYIFQPRQFVNIIAAPEATYISIDYAVGSGVVKYVGGRRAEVIWMSPGKLPGNAYYDSDNWVSSEVYSLRRVNENELWLILSEPRHLRRKTPSGIWRLTKPAGSDGRLGDWTGELILDEGDGKLNKLCYYNWTCQLFDEIPETFPFLHASHQFQRSCLRVKIRPTDTTPPKINTFSLGTPTGNVVPVTIDAVDEQTTCHIDNVAPVIQNFSIPATSSSLEVPVTLSVSDGSVETAGMLSFMMLHSGDLSC